MIDLSKFTFNNKILNKVVTLRYNQVYSQTLFFFILLLFDLAIFPVDKLSHIAHYWPIIFLFSVVCVPDVVNTAEINFLPTV